MIDAHVHFWRLDRGDYRWITSARPVLCRDYLPDDFRKLTEGTPVKSCIAIQAAPTEAETEFLLSLADENPWIKGVIGWTDLTLPAAQETLDRWKGQPKFKGIRPMAGIQSGTEWLGPEYNLGLDLLAENDLVLEALALPHHLNAVATVARTHPNLQIVLNHAAKPTPDYLKQWSDDLTAFIALPNVTCKLSGLTQQSRDLSHYARVFEKLLGAFGPPRLLWGSDHPVLHETSTYDVWLKASEGLFASVSQAEVRQITQSVAKRVYTIGL